MPPLLNLFFKQARQSLILVQQTVNSTDSCCNQKSGKLNPIFVYILINKPYDYGMRLSITKVKFVPNKALTEDNFLIFT